MVRLLLRDELGPHLITDGPDRLVKRLSGRWPLERARDQVRASGAGPAI